MADFQSLSKPNPNPNSKKPVLCEECRENQWKYRCPGCGLVSCSLPCVKSHKERLGCTGKRSRTELVPISEFDDKALLSDYNFLEETKQVSEAARRIITGFGAGYAGYLPPRLAMLRKAALKRKTVLYFLPKGMSKGQSNQSRFDIRRNCIYWTIEWRFCSVHSTLIDHGLKNLQIWDVYIPRQVDQIKKFSGSSFKSILQYVSVPETERLETLVQKHLSPTPWNDNLTSYRNVSLSDLRFFVQKSAKISKSPYRELDIKLPLSSQLRSVLILEYPVIHVLVPSETPDFDIEKRAIPAITKERDNVCPSNQVRDSLAEEPAAKCRVYKEEEIEEGETESETRVIDLSEDAAQTSKFGGGKRLLPGGTPDFDIEKHVTPAITNNRDNVGPSNQVRDSLAEDPAAKCREEEREEGETESETCVVDLSEDAAQSSKFGGEPSMRKYSTVASPAEERSGSRNSMKEIIEGLNYDQEVKQAYNDLLGEIDPDDFLCFDDDGFINSVHNYENNPLGFGEELEEGEIPE